MSTIDRPRLRRRIRDGHDQSEWCRKLRKVRISFGSVRTDPHGSIAAALYRAELATRKVGLDPRAGFRTPGFLKYFGRWNPSWIIAGPLAKLGTSIVDAHAGLLQCQSCREQWVVRWREGSELPKKAFICPRGCNAGRSAAKALKKVKEAMRLAQQPDQIPPAVAARLQLLRDQGWQPAPPRDIDVDAANEGRAIGIANKRRLKQPRKRRKSTHTMRELAAHDQHAYAEG